VDRLGQLLSVELFHLGPVVEGIDVRRSAILQKINDVFRLGRKIGKARQSADLLLPLGSRQIASQQRSQRRRAQPDCIAAEELPTSEESSVILLRCHLRFNLLSFHCVYLRPFPALTNRTVATRLQLLLRNRLIEIEQHSSQAGPGGQFRWSEF